jgi:hypothetical protein
MDLLNLSEEEIDYLVDHPDVYIESARTIKGRKFSLSRRPYLRSIYRQFKPFRPRTVIWMSARKCEKTETVCNVILEKETMMSYFSATYTIARQQQVNVFSTERLTQAINTSQDGIFDSRLIKPTNVSHKTFFDDPGGEHPNHLYLYSAWGEAVSLLGQANDLVVVDEAQDMPGVWYPKVYEILKLSEHKWMLVCGTARDSGDEFDRLWKLSTMNEWFVTCKHCGKEQILKFPDNIMGPDGNRYKGCVSCRKVLDVRKGLWKHTCPNIKKALFVGFHTNQIMHPMITANDIWISWMSYESERAFYNEVMGISFSGGYRPVSIEDVLKCTKSNMRYKFTDEGKENVGGMDCGKGHHITIMDDNRRILHQEVVDTRLFTTSQQVIDHIAKIIRRYNVKTFVVDFGYGQNETKDLQSIFGPRVRGCRYGSQNFDKIVEYRERDDDGFEIYRYNVNRTRVMDIVITNFAKHKYSIPYEFDPNKKLNSRQQAEKTFHHYTNLTSDVAKRFEGKEYTKPRGTEAAIKYGRSGPDHFFHTLVYCEIALRKERRSGRTNIVMID